MYPLKWCKVIKQFFKLLSMFKKNNHHGSSFLVHVSVGLRFKKNKISVNGNPQWSELRCHVHTFCMKWVYQKTLPLMLRRCAYKHGEQKPSAWDRQEERLDSSVVPPFFHQPLGVLRWSVQWGPHQQLQSALKTEWSCAETWGCQEHFPSPSVSAAIYF